MDKSTTYTPHFREWVQRGSNVVVDTAFGLTPQYDCKHHLQVGVGPELYGVLCRLCGNVNPSASDGIVASHGTGETQTVDFTPPW